jgi:hypothetical protein
MTINEILGKVFVRRGLENGPKGQKRIVVGGDVSHVTKRGL